MVISALSHHSVNAINNVKLPTTIAVVIYATIPATRYTIEGLRSVPSALHDAGSMSGVNRLQRWMRIELPLAFPHMMLGINQTAVFALFMVISALSHHSVNAINNVKLPTTIADLIPPII